MVSDLVFGVGSVSVAVRHVIEGVGKGKVLRRSFVKKTFYLSEAPWKKTRARKQWGACGR